jgi:cell division ATPase FtsA
MPKWWKSENKASKLPSTTDLSSSVALLSSPSTVTPTKDAPVTISPARPSQVATPQVEARQAPSNAVGRSGQPSVHTAPYVGLDFGTSTTLLAKSRGVSGTEVIPIGRSTAWLPSVVGYRSGGGQPVLGEDAEVLPAAQVKRSIKRAITFGEEMARFHLPDGVLERPADEVASQVVSEALRRADWDLLKGQVAGVRAGCPAMWDAQQRGRLRGILANAGLHVEPDEIIDEPIAAAVAWVNYRRQAFGERVEGRLVVFDYGGGTLDIAVCEVAWELDLPEITVLSCLGIPVAGDSLDDKLHALVREQLVNDSRFEGSVQQEAAVLREVRGAKEALSSTLDVRLELAPYGLGSLQLSRAELEREFRPQLGDALRYVTAALRAARLREKNHLGPTALRALDESSLDPSVDFVLLAGGMSRVPAVGEALQRRFAHARVERVADTLSGGIEGPQHLVAAGLIHDPGTYDRLNLHRPGFNLRVEWRSRSGPWEGQDIYTAHTPLYSDADIWNGNSRPGVSGQVTIPPSGEVYEARLVVTAESGERLSLRLDRAPIEGLALRVRGGARVTVKLYVDGRILVLVNDHEQRFDGASVRIERWQVIRGPGSRRRQVELVTDHHSGLGNFAYPHK